MTHNCKASVGKGEENGWIGRAEGEDEGGRLVDYMEGGGGGGGGQGRAAALYIPLSLQAAE